jgi:hypothetical protein
MTFRRMHAQDGVNRTTTDRTSLVRIKPSAEAIHAVTDLSLAISVGSLMADFNRNLLHAILEGQYADNVTMSAVNRTMDKANFEKMKSVYNTCMDEDAIKTYGVKPVRDLLLEFENVFPMDGASAAAGNDELTKAIVWLAKHSISGLVSSGTGVSLKKYAYSRPLLLIRFVTVERPMT